VRQPAAFCGVIGLKPTYSRVSRHGLIAYGSSFDCIGIFSKNVYDSALVLEVIAGHDEYDSTVSTKPVPAFSTELSSSSAKKYRVAYMHDTLESEALQPEIKQSIYKKIDQLKTAGHEVDAIDFSLNEFVLPTYYILATAEASSNLSRYDGVRFGHRSAASQDVNTMYKKTRSEGFGQEVQRRIMLGTFVLSARYYDAYYTKAQKVRRLIREQIKAIFANHDFIILPTTPTTAFRLGEHTNNPVEMYLADLYSVQANVAGVPGISIPCGVDANNLPIGIQVMADDFEEGKLFQFSEIIQNLG
jgi:aspartyl-tRNA(Asn)/glutamyl-tRNA(Gln) amidotransferase subunit A